MNIFKILKKLVIKPKYDFDFDLIANYGLTVECDGLKIMSGISFVNLVQLVLHTGQMEILNLTGNVKISLHRD